MSAAGCYTGERDGAGGVKVYRPDGSSLDVAPSLAVWPHSPTGFNWGYSGSGPAQLALALLDDHTGNSAMAERYHQQFKREVVSRWHGGTWSLDPREIDAWLAVVAR